VRTKLEYASVAWHSITTTDSSRLERVQRKFAALCSRRFFVAVCCNDNHGILAILNLSKLYSSRRHLDAIFLTNVLKNKICCSYTPDSVSVRIPTRIIWDCSIFMTNQNFKVSFLQQAVFLLIMLFVRALRFLTKIIFHLRTFYNITYT
jgi:hypothetical protein